MLLTSGNLIAQQMTRTSNSHLCQHSFFISNVLFPLFLFFLVYSSAQGIFPLTFSAIIWKINLRPCFFIKYPCKSILHPPEFLHLCLLVLKDWVWGGRREEGSGWGTHVYLWRIHFDIWQNQYNIVKLKNKIKIYTLKKVN